MFEQAVRQPMIVDDPAPNNLPVSQRDFDGFLVPCLHTLPKIPLRDRKRRSGSSVILDDLGNLIEEC